MDCCGPAALLQPCHQSARACTPPAAAPQTCPGAHLLQMVHPCSWIPISACRPFMVQCQRCVQGMLASWYGSSAADEGISRDCMVLLLIREAELSITVQGQPAAPNQEEEAALQAGADAQGKATPCSRRWPNGCTLATHRAYNSLQHSPAELIGFCMQSHL